MNLQMKKRFVVTSALFFFSLFWIPSPLTAQSPTTNDRTSVELVSRIMPGDMLHIEVAGLSHPRQSRQVAETGVMSFPLVSEGTFVICLTADELAKKLTVAYREYQIDPKISVRIESRSIRTATVNGAVKNPTQFELRRQARLSELIALAGGLNPHATEAITVSRPGGWRCEGEQSIPFDPQEFSVDFSAIQTGSGTGDLPILPGDHVQVESRPQVFVVGEVVAPKIVDLEQANTLLKAIAAAGGPLPDARIERVKILRVVLNSTRRQEIIVDLKAISKKKIDDVLLQDNDIIDVPHKHPGHGGLNLEGMSISPPFMIVE